MTRIQEAKIIRIEISASLSADGKIHSVKWDNATYKQTRMFFGYLVRTRKYFIAKAGELNRIFLRM